MPYILQFLLVVLLAVLACIKVTIQGFASRNHIRTTLDSVWFNALLFTVITVFLVILFPMGEINDTLVFYAALMTLTTVVFQVCYTIALNSGPVSLTVLIGNFHVLITTTFSCVVLGEKLYLTQMVGIALLVTSMFLGSQSKPDEKKATRRWLLLTLLCMSCSATFGIGQKLFLATPESKLPNAQATELAVSYALAAVAGFIIYFINSRRSGEKSPLGLKKPVILYALGIGLSLCVYQRLNVYALSVVEGTFQFPTYAGLQSLGMTLVGIVLFKDKLTRRQQLSVVCGILCVVLMNMRMGPCI